MQAKVHMHKVKSGIAPAGIVYFRYFSADQTHHATETTTLFTCPFCHMANRDFQVCCSTCLSESAKIPAVSVRVLLPLNCSWEFISSLACRFSNLALPVMTPV